jgi:isopentenyl diphosphate isomerase/L-lactate dehydrogenase-like FMN-dependent dehydrogenase
MPVMMPAFSHLGCFNGHDVKIIVDCGISSGADVFKALALGADAAAVGRSMLPSLENEGTAGVLDFIKDVQKELRFIMSCTGYAKTSDIDDICIKKLL